jgi:hypothetical protein
LSPPHVRRFAYAPNREVMLEVVRQPRRVLAQMGWALRRHNTQSAGPASYGGTSSLMTSGQKPVNKKSIAAMMA